MIPWASPIAQYRAHKQAIQTAVRRVLESGVYVLGSEVDAFESAFADYCGVRYGVGVGSGTDALILALKALGVGPGDEVITVSHTAIATAAAVIATGATPVLVDVDPVYYTLDTDCLQRAVTPRSKAVIAVHLYGQAADINAILSIARPRGLAVIEDCAQATGGRLGSDRVGSLGDIGCFSFYPTKNLGAIGDGGMVLTANADLAERVRRFRQYGWDEARQTKECGLNSRLDPLQAAILNVKLPHLDADNTRRAAIADRYNRSLVGLPVNLPAARPRTNHVYHLYVIACDVRDGLMAHLAGVGIGAAVHYPFSVHRHGGYCDRVVIPKDGLPVTDQLVGQIVSLPMYPELSDAEVDRVIAAVQDYFRSPS